jgi:hypothetical protein
MSKINERCAGIDVGKRFLLCCALTGAAQESRGARRGDLTQRAGSGAAAGLAEFEEHHARGDGEYRLVLGSVF